MDIELSGKPFGVCSLSDACMLGAHQACYPFGVRELAPDQLVGLIDARL